MNQKNQIPSVKKPAEDTGRRPMAKTIQPIEISPEKRRLPGDNSNRRYGFKALVLICTLVLLIFGGGWLLRFLAQNEFDTRQTAGKNPPPSKAIVTRETVKKSPDSPPVVEPPENQSPEKRDAERQMAQYLTARDRLDRIAASEWGGRSYQEMIAQGQQADDRFMEKQYVPAAGLYKQAADLAAELFDRTVDAFKRLVADGNKAIDAGDGPLARRNFALALKIEPADPRAQHGLQRAETIETVMQLMASGSRHEAQSAFVLAREQYAKALEIDPDSEKAREALQHIDGRITERKFQELMSAGLTAFHRNDYQLARTRLLQARGLQPKNREVIEALMQVDQAIRLSEIERLRQTAAAAEDAENWQKALESYLAVLKIDKNLQFAVHGREHALKQIKLAKRVGFFLDSPQVLESGSQLENAINLLNELSLNKPPGAKLAGRISELKNLVEIARTPVEIVIESDNLTQIAIYRIGRLGRFIMRELELRPGTYTVVGTRDGYQDVRRQIVVKSGRQPLHITVKCKVAI